MAIGCARFFGFDAGKNFDHPYLAQSVGDFWRRWHISLSSWLRDYVYIPLGGSRVALPRIYLNLIITFLASGIWHGSSWNFVLWGLLHGFYQCAGRAAKPLLEKAKIPTVVKIAVTFCLVTFAWIFFRAENTREAMGIIQKITRIPTEIAQLISFSPISELKMQFKEYFALTDPNFGFLKGMAKLVALLIMFIACEFVTRQKTGIAFIKERPLLARWGLYIVLILFIWIIRSSEYSGNFIYQNF